MGGRDEARLVDLSQAVPVRLVGDAVLGQGVARVLDWRPARAWAARLLWADLFGTAP
jgi:hypothetical protein